jgi:hypothetical protein
VVRRRREVRTEGGSIILEHSVRPAALRIAR